MTNVNWTKPGRGWKKGGLAAALASLAIVGTLAVGSNVYAQGGTAMEPGTAQNVVMAHRGGKGGAHLAVVAKALGMDEAALKTELLAGKTIAQVAASKNVALSAVSDAILADEKTKLAQSVTDGKLTQAQADQRLASAPTRITEMLNSTKPAGTVGGIKGGSHGGAHLAVVATALGMDEAALKTELQAGKTISAVAASKNIALSVVSNALLDTEKTKLAQAVTDGKLTQAQADARLATATTHITDLLNGTLPAGKPGKGVPGTRGPKPGTTKPTTSPTATPLPGA